METVTAKQARLDPTVRASMKDQQLARLALKEKMQAGEITAEEYSAAYAAQPAQIRKAAASALQAAERAAKRSEAFDASIADAQGAADAFKGA